MSDLSLKGGAERRRSVADQQLLARLEQATRLLGTTDYALYYLRPPTEATMHPNPHHAALSEIVAQVGKSVVSPAEIQAKLAEQPVAETVEVVEEVAVAEPPVQATGGDMASDARRRIEYELRNGNSTELRFYNA